MLEIKNLHASVEDKEILRGIDLVVRAGEVHAIMGPNGSGKSTLAGVLSGREEYEVTAGEVSFQGQDLLDLDPEERAREGLFLAFQYPVEIPGVNTQVFLRAALNAVRAHRGQDELDAVSFLKLVREKAKLVEMNQALLNRPVNEGFSGGEKKRAEIFQMALLEPKLSILDETDSGLDIDALRIVSHGVNTLKGEANATIVITHYQRLLDYIVPDFVHVLYQGRIVKSGGKELALELEEKGYDWIKAEAERDAELREASATAEREEMDTAREQVAIADAVQASSSALDSSHEMSLPAPDGLSSNGHGGEVMTNEEVERARLANLDTDATLQEASAR